MSHKIASLTGIFSTLLLSGCISTSPYEQALYAGKQPRCIECDPTQPAAAPIRKPEYPAAIFTAKPHKQAYKVVAPTDVRSGPGHEYKVAYRMTSGAILTTEAKLDNGWMKLASGDHYVPISALSALAPAAQSLDSQKTRLSTPARRRVQTAQPAKPTTPTSVENPGVPAEAQNPASEPIELDFKTI